MNTEREVVELARMFHDEYEKAARVHNWSSQQSCRVEFDDLPDENKRTMLATCRAVLKRQARAQQDDAGGAAREVQASRVMPLIGPLLDAWDGLGNDQRNYTNGFQRHMALLAEAEARDIDTFLARNNTEEPQPAALSCMAGGGNGGGSSPTCPTCGSPVWDAPHKITVDGTVYYYRHMPPGLDVGCEDPWHAEEPSR